MVVREITAHPTEPLEALPRTLLELGFALVLLSFVPSAYRDLRRVPYARLAAAVVVALVSLLAGSTGGLVVLSLDSVIIFAMLVYEKVGASSTRSGPAVDRPPRGRRIIIRAASQHPGRAARSMAHWDHD